MSQPALERELCYSKLAEDPDCVELVELFVHDLGDRLAELRRAETAHDWDAVGCLAHQIKGAGGSYGFPGLTAAALDLEHAARKLRSPSEIAIALDQLAEVCGRVRAGIPQ